MMDEQSSHKETSESENTSPPQKKNDGDAPVVAKRKPLGLKVPDSSTPEKTNAAHIRQNLSHGRSKTVMVEVRHRRLRKDANQESQLEKDDVSKLTTEEHALRLKALQQAISLQAEEEKRQEELATTISMEPEKEEEKQKEKEEVHKKEEGDVTSSALEKSPEHTTPLAAKKQDFHGERKKEFDGRRSSKDSFEEEKTENKKARLLAETSKRRGSGGTSSHDKTMDTSGSEEKKAIIGLKKLRKKSSGRHSVVSSVVSRKIHIPPHITVQELARRMAYKASFLIKALRQLGEENVSFHQVLSAETAEYFVKEHGHEAILLMNVDKEEELWMHNMQDDIKPRPPIVTVMGHVDHGKTSLLDALRKTSVVQKEAGGITQHIGAYQVVLKSGKKITFIDTPGHKAFSQMRMRGAHLTDIVVLVIAADDGVNAQTVEAITHAKEANVPIIVAITKMDKHGVNPDKIREQLLSHDVIVEKLGGDVLDVEVSSTTGKNLDLLEETILLQAELLHLDVGYAGYARGIVLETHMKKGYGPVATVMVQRGTLKTGDTVVMGDIGGKVRLLFNDLGQSVKTAEPSTPVEVCGLGELPQPGNRFMAIESDAHMKEFLAWKAEYQREKDLAPRTGPEDLLSMESLFSTSPKEFPIIIKADVQGSLEGLAYELSHITHKEVAIKIVHQGLGPITESDILLAKASNACVIAFNVGILPAAKTHGEREKISLIQHKVVYHIVDDIKKKLSALLAPEVVETYVGTSTVLQLFIMSRGKHPYIAGNIVKDGVMRRGEKIRILRNGTLIHTDTIESLYQGKNESKEVKAGQECGIGFREFKDIQPDDVIECFHTENVYRTIL